MFGLWGSAEGSAFGLQLSTMSTGETHELTSLIRMGSEAKPGCAIAADGWHTSPCICICLMGPIFFPRWRRLVGLLCLVLLGIRSPGASALVTEDLQHDISEARLPSVPLGVATAPGTR